MSTPPVRIGVDATGWSDRRGFGRFTRNVITQLVKVDEGRAYVLFVDEGTAATDLPEATQRRLPLRRPIAGAGKGRSVLDVGRLGVAASREKLDAFLFPSLLTYVPLVGVPTVVGLHDSTPDEMPEMTLPTSAARILWRAKQWIAVRTAARLFTVSEAARATLAKRLGLDPAALPVVPEAPDSVFFPRSDDEAVRAQRSVGLRADEPFLLHAGGMSPHKNLGTLIAAFAGLEPPRPKLVLAGETEGGPYPTDVPRLEALARVSGVEDDVLFPGFLSDETLAGLYSSAVAVVAPSLAEGFGLPAVEAAVCGAAAVLSDLPPHRESMGDAALYFPPTDTAALRSTLERVIADEALRQALSERGRRAVSGLSWAVSAAKLRALLDDAASEGRRG